MSGLSEQQLAEIREQIGDAQPASDDLLIAFAEQIRDRREHDHASAGPDWDWYCLNASGWLGDKSPTLLRRLLDAEAEAERLRAERDRFADRVDTITAVAKSNKRHVATLTEELATAQARITALERQITTASTAHVPGLCPPCKRGECDECMAVDHPDLPGLYTCHYVPNPHQACRQARRGGERP